MARSSISCSNEHRKFIRKLKDELEEATGREPTDRDVIDLLINTFREYRNVSLLSLAKELANQLEGIVSLLNIIDSYETLKKENEELRKENERLREQLKNQTVVSNAREAFVLFVRKVTEEAEGQLSKETQDKLLTILTELHGIFNGSGLNWERIKEIAEAISR